jgi:hypothetical protein
VIVQSVSLYTNRLFVKSCYAVLKLGGLQVQLKFLPLFLRETGSGDSPGSSGIHTTDPTVSLEMDIPYLHTDRVF